MQRFIFPATSPLEKSNCWREFLSHVSSNSRRILFSAFRMWCLNLHPAETYWLQLLFTIVINKWCIWHRVSPAPQGRSWFSRPLFASLSFSGSLLSAKRNLSQLIAHFENPRKETKFLFPKETGVSSVFVARINCGFFWISGFVSALNKLWMAIAHEERGK